MSVLRWESLTLLETPGTIRGLGGLTLTSPFVAGIELAPGRNYYHHDLSKIEAAGDITKVVVELPLPKAERLCELFRRLYSSDRTPPPEFDCRAGLDFLIGASEDITHTVNSYAIRGPMDPNELEPGEPYMILASNSVHDFLAADRTTGLHVAGPGGGLGHTPAVDMMRMWEGTLQKVTGWEI